MLHIGSAAAAGSVVAGVRAGALGRSKVGVAPWRALASTSGSEANSGSKPPRRDEGGLSAELKYHGEAAAEVAETIMEAGRLGLNEVLRHALGLEVKKLPRTTIPETRGLGGGAGGSFKAPSDSSFWNPYAKNSPFMNKQKYLEQFERLRDSVGQPTRYSALEVVTEEEIEAYVDALSEDGSLKSFQGLASVLVPKTLYSNVVKVALRVLQVTLGGLDGQVVLGRELYLLRRRSIRAQWRVSKKYTVDQEIVKRLVRRVMADHGTGPDILGAEVQQQMYHNVVTLIFRLVFDLMDSCQLRVLGHTVTINIDVDANLAQAPGWDISLDSGIFGRFDSTEKREFASYFVDELLKDTSINIKALPDIIERQLYINVVMLLFEMSETAGNHLRLHLAGISFRPALDDLKAKAKDKK